MKWLSVERTLCNLLNVYGRGRRRCGGSTIQAERFPLVGNAHRAFRGGKTIANDVRSAHPRRPYNMKHDVLKVKRRPRFSRERRFVI